MAVAEYRGRFGSASMFWLGFLHFFGEIITINFELCG